MPATANWLNFSATPLTLTCNGQIVSRATGFFLKPAEDWFLITNWHVLSGRHPKTGQPLSKSGAVPDRCTYLLASLTDANITWSARTHDLGDPLTGSAHWLQHAELGQNADIAAFRVDGVVPLQVRNILEKPGHDEQMWVDIGDDLFLPGYPLGLTAGGAMPIWKRASLASSTEFAEGSKFVFVDTATREGMSGSPCLAISNRYYFRRAIDSMKMTRIDDPLAWKLMGVYSGRLNPSDSFEAQIGIVWREGLVLETIQNGLPAKVVLQPSGQE